MERDFLLPAAGSRMQDIVLHLETSCVRFSSRSLIMREEASFNATLSTARRAVPAGEGEKELPSDMESKGIFRGLRLCAPSFMNNAAEVRSGLTADVTSYSFFQGISNPLGFFALHSQTLITATVKASMISIFLSCLMHSTRKGE